MEMCHINSYAKATVKVSCRLLLLLPISRHSLRTRLFADCSQIRAGAAKDTGLPRFHGFQGTSITTRTRLMLLTIRFLLLLLVAFLTLTLLQLWWAILYQITLTIQARPLWLSVGNIETPLWVEHVTSLDH